MRLACGWKSRILLRLKGGGNTSKIGRRQTRMSGNSRKHSWPYVFSVMKSKDVIRPPVAFKRFMETDLSFDRPADMQQGDQNPNSLS
jgi:hypothetical protein